MDDLQEKVEAKEKILLVDDEENFVTYSKHTLSKAGFHCEIARSGNEAFQMLQTGVFDLLISDLRMPNMGGIELARKVRRDLKMPIPIIVLSGFLPDRITIFDAGVQAVLGKPLDLPALLLKIKSFRDPVAHLTLPPPTAQVQGNLTTHDRGLLERAFTRSAAHYQVGLGGVFISDSYIGLEPIERGSILEMNLRIADHPAGDLRGHCLVQWIRYTPVDNLAAGVGLEIIHLDEPSRNSFFDFCQKSKPIAYIPAGSKLLEKSA